jgi:hypothetical protein
MSKNLTRKGIAFGALVALATSAFAGAPATAAVSDSIVTGLATGTSYNSVVGYSNGLKVTTTLAPSNSANASTLTYRVSNPSGAKLQISAGTGTLTRATATSGDVTIWDTEATPAVSATDADATADGAHFETSLTSFNVVLGGGEVGTSSVDNDLLITVADADVDVAVDVYAWLDSSSNSANVQSSTELYGNTVSLKFYDQKNITATTELVYPVTGDASVQAKISTTPELNGEQLGELVDASWTTQGNANAVLAKNTSSDADFSPVYGDTVYNGTTKKWTSTAYVKFSKGTDSFNGENLTLDGYSDLSAITGGVGTSEATVRTTNDTTRVTLRNLVGAGFPTSNAGTYAISAWLTTSTQASRLTATAARVLTIASSTAITYDADGPTDSSSNGDGALATGAASFWSVGTHATVQASGIYSATPYIGTQKLGAASSSTNSAITASDTKASVAVSENVAAGYNEDASVSDTVELRTGTTSVSAKATVYYVDADTGVKKVAPAGIPVTGALTTAIGTFQINAAGASVTSDVEYTDANGQVTFTVTSTTAALNNTVILTITPQSLSGATAAQFHFVWQDAAYTIADLNDTYAQDGNSSYRRIATSGTYTFNFAVLDQWGKAADAAKYRLQVSNTGRTVSSNTYTLSNGRVAVAVADGAQGSGTTITTTVNLQKLVTDTWTTQDTESWDADGKGKVVINVADAAAESFLAGINAGTTYATARGDLVTTWLTENISGEKVEAQDRRVSKVNKPSYGTTAVVSGRLINKSTGLAHGGATVTVSGPSTILFSAGNVDALGTITVIADNEGDFNVSLVSNTAQEDAVITYTSASGATKTVKVTFLPALTTSGTVLSVSASAATPGKTLVFTGKLTDKWGNAVKTSDAVSRATLRVTYTGPGLLSGALPTETEADGTFTVRVLLGTSDTGSAVVKATYGAKNLTISSADTGDNIDIVATATAVIGGAVTAGSTAAVAGSTGKFYVSVTNAAAKKVVIKVAGKFVKSFTGTAAKKTVVTKSTKGSKKVTVFVGGKLVATKTVTVK